MADPAPIAQTFFVDPQLQRKCYLDAIITMVDAGHIIKQLTRERAEGVKNEPAEQLAFADRIILNKIDLMPEQAARDTLKRELRAYNPMAEIIEAEQSQVDPTKLLRLEAFSLDNVLLKEPDFLEDNGVYIYSDPNHDAAISSVCVTTDTPMSHPMLSEWVSGILGTHGENLFRYKGIINVFGSNKRFVVQVFMCLFFDYLLQ
jgi:G3E family GTPase